MATQAQREAVARYDSENTMQIKMKLNRKTDADIIEWLNSQDNRQGYLKALIRKDIKSRG